MIPLWHKVGFEEVSRYSPMLAGRFSPGTRDRNLLETTLWEIRPDLSQKVESRANPANFSHHLSSNPYMSTSTMNAGSLTLYLAQHNSSVDWQHHVNGILACYGMVGLRYTSGLNIIFEDEFCNEVLESMYQRIFGRAVDEVGRVTYLPFIFLKGREGVRRIEGFMLSSNEYRHLRLIEPK